MGKKISQILVDQSGLGFSSLQQLFQDQYHVFMGISETSKKPKEFSAQKTSLIVFELEKELEKIFTEHYMQAPKTDVIEPQISNKVAVYWQPEALHPVIKAIASEEKFIEEDIAKMPVGSQEKLRVLASEGIQNFIRFTLKHGQKEFTKLHKEASETDRDALLKTISVFEEKENLIKILQTLSKAHAGKDYVNLRDTLNKTALYLLEELTYLLENSGSYLPRDLQNLEWWDGSTGAGLKAFGAPDRDALVLSMKHQFQYLEKLVKRAGPVIDYLKNPIAESEYYDHALVDKWDTIVKAVRDKTTKKGSSLTDLESFFTDEMNTITAKNAEDKIPISDVAGESHDYFINIRKKVERSLLGRAEILNRMRSVEDYNSIADFFNKKIAGKFPFMEERGPVDEVDLETLWEFFELYDEKGGSPESILASIYEMGNFKKHMEFLKKIHMFRELLDDWFSGTSDSKAPIFDIELEFRINRDSEENGKYVYKMWFDPSSTQHIKNVGGKSVMGRWRYGEPITLGFEWSPQNSEAPVPVPNDNFPYLSVDGRKAEISFEGNWSLFSLLVELQTTDTEIKRLLRITIPQSNAKPTVVFHRIAVLKPAKNSKKPKKVYLQVPIFPYKAPDLPCLTDMANKPLLLEKKLHCVSSSDKVGCEKYKDVDIKKKCPPEKKEKPDLKKTEETESSEDENEEDG